MAERWEETEVLIPKNTPVAASNFSFSAPEGEVIEAEITIPYGHANLTGVAIIYSGVQVIPRGTGRWVRGNDRKHRFDLDNFPTGNGWTWVGFNNDLTYDHTFHIHWGILELADEALPLPPVVLLPLAGSFGGGSAAA